MTSVVLTRSQLENEAFKQELNGYDFTFIDLPLIEYENLEFNKDTFESFSNIITTSKHAAKMAAFRCIDFKSNVRFWVVGVLSANILKAAGLNVEYEACNVEDLIHKLPQKICEDCLYLSANEITMDMPKRIKRQIIYNVKYKQQLACIEAKSLNERVNYILLYSVNTAKTFIKLVEQCGLQIKLQNATFITISAGVAKEILPYFKKIIYCEKGKHTKMIELLTSHAETSRKFKSIN